MPGPKPENTGLLQVLTPQVRVKTANMIREPFQKRVADVLPQGSAPSSNSRSTGDLVPVLGLWNALVTMRTIVEGCVLRKVYDLMGVCCDMLCARLKSPEERLDTRVCRQGFYIVTSIGFHMHAKLVITGAKKPIVPTPPSTSILAVCTR